VKNYITTINILLGIGVLVYKKGQIHDLQNK